MVKHVGMKVSVLIRAMERTICLYAENSKHFLKNHLGFTLRKALQKLSMNQRAPLQALWVLWGEGVALIKVALTPQRHVYSASLAGK